MAGPPQASPVSPASRPSDDYEDSTNMSFGGNGFVDDAEVVEEDELLSGDGR
jgi:hypothetical protein